MFVHISDEDAKDLKENGKLSCVPNGKGAPYVPEHKYKVSYRRNHLASMNTTIFDCFLMETALTILVRKITQSNATRAMREGMRYFYLDWFLRDLYENSLKRGKARMVAYATIPHMTEIMADMGFQEIGVTKTNEARGTIDSRKKTVWTK